MDPKIFNDAVDFAVDPNTRSAFVTGFAIALTIGYFAGVLSCKFLYLLARMIVSEIRRETRLRKEERQRRDKAEHRRLEAEALEKEHRDFIALRIERHIHVGSFGHIVDDSGHVYCPECFDRKRLVAIVTAGDVFICPECGHEM